MATTQEIKDELQNIWNLASKLATDAESADEDLPAGVQEAIAAGATVLGIGAKILADIPG